MVVGVEAVAYNLNLRILFTPLNQMVHNNEC